MAFEHDCFQKYEINDIPLGRDLFLMDVVWMQEWEAANIARSEGDESADPYTVGPISRAHAAAVRESGVEISWYPNTSDRFHELKTFLPREAFVSAALAWEYDKRPTIFVTSDWLRHLHLRANSIFAMIDAADMTKEIEAGRLNRNKLIELRDRIDTVAMAHPHVSFISFADSLLLKTNWVGGIFDSGITYNYRPETLLLLFREIRTVYRAVLNLDIYGVFAQGSNEYYDDPLLHIAGNHISLNSLGLPFAQIMLIESAARAAIRRTEHDRYELYLDEDFFHSLKFKRFKSKGAILSAPYKPKMTSESGRYFCAQCDELIAKLTMPQ